MLNRAKGLWYPRVNAQADGGKEDINKQDTTQSTSKYRNVQTLSANQLIYDFGGASGSITQAEGTSKEAATKLEQVRQEIMIQGITAFLGVIRSREMLRYAVRSEENIKTLSGMQEALVERGVGLSYEELQIKAQLAGAQAHKVNAERALINSRNAYRSSFGVDLTQEQIDALILPALPQKTMPQAMDSALENALSANPFLVELQYSLQSRQGDLTARQSTMFPKLEAVADVARKENDQGELGIRTEGRAGLQVTYNLFSGFRDAENISASRSEITSVRKTILDRRRSIEEKVRNAWNDLVTLRKNIDLYSNQANITWFFLELVKKKKALGGEVNLLDILVGERDYISATSSKVTAEIDHITVAYQLLYQMGQISTDVVEN
jgi:adhesin transport system outer membrane protein